MSIKGIRKIRNDLKSFAEEESLKAIELIYYVVDKYVRKINIRRIEAYAFHYSNRSDMFHYLGLDEVVEIMSKSSSVEKNECLYKLGTKHIELLEYKLKAAIKYILT